MVVIEIVQGDTVGDDRLGIWGVETWIRSAIGWRRAKQQYRQVRC